MPKSRPDKTLRPSSSKKRVLVGGYSKPMKQAKIESYFSSLCPVSWDSEETGSQTGPLSDEQKKVLKMVVDEGKNVFFTGAAGVWSAPVQIPLGFVVGDLAFFLLTRNREIATAPSYHCSLQEQICETTGCRLRDSQHRDGCLKY